ncbi:MAG TPA: hypothetical protein VFB30_19625 [Spirochaetia bacterium]|nr:hypothetical protein [Spirochaetia bacterium]
MLHDPGSYSPPQRYTDIRLSAAEKEVLRRLGQETASVAALPVHREKAGLWRKLNDLESARPMVWINEIPWHEMNVDDELTLQTVHPWARELETRLRRALYQWRHMPGDMVVSDFIECPLAVHSTDFGIHEEVDVARTDAANDIVSRHFHVQIKEPEDIEKIRMPRVSHDEETTVATFAAMEDLFRGIMPVRKVGQTHIWFTPWDYLIRWWGLQEAMMDLVERPDMVNAAVERMVDAWMVELDQFLEQNLLSLDCNNTRIGSGGYGYTWDLPGTHYNPSRVQPRNMWGCSNAQIFSDVSPDMHWEFALRHDLRWLERWGLTYYGCCEPLDKKIALLRRIPNLRKISMSPWNNFAKVIDEVQGDYVLSFKPSPAIFVEETWNPDKARAVLKGVLDRARGVSHVEIIMKDISTLCYKPQRLWDWARIAMEVVQESA